MEEQPRWLRVLFGLWLVALILMPTQYAATRLGVGAEGSAVQRIIVIWPYDTVSFSAAPGEDPGQAFLRALPGAPPVVCISPSTLAQVQHKLNQFPFIGLADLLVALLFGLWVLLALKNRRQLAWCKWPPVAVWAFLGAALLSGINAADVEDWATECVQLFLYFLAGFTLAANLLRTEKQVRQATLALTLATVAVIALGVKDYYQHIFGAPPALEDPLMVRSTFTSRAVFGGYLALVLPLFLGLLLQARRWASKLGWALLLILGAVPVLTAGTLIALLATSLILLVGTARKFVPAFIRVLILLAVAGGVMYFPSERHLPYLWQSVALFDEAGARQAAQGRAVDEFTAKRYREWLAACRLLSYDGWQERWSQQLEQKYAQAEAAGQEFNPEAERPQRSVLPNIVLGVGAGENYQASIGQHYGSLPNPSLEKMEPDTHNVYLLVASQMGLLGLFALLHMAFDFMGRARRVLRAQSQGYPAALALGLWGCLLSFLIYSLWGSLLTRGTSLVLVTLLALIATLERLYAVNPPSGAPVGSPAVQQLPGDS
jgi:hypothetical protein